MHADLGDLLKNFKNDNATYICMNNGRSQVHSNKGLDNWLRTRYSLEWQDMVSLFSLLFCLLMQQL